MASINVNPIRSLKGEIVAPPSKSYSHRAFIAASLAEGVSIIKNPLTLGDVEITIEILRLLGVKVLKQQDDRYIIEKIQNSFSPYKENIDCRNSGTSVRIFSALSLLVEGGLTFKGEFFKRNRPILPLLKALEALGAEYHISENELTVKRLTNKCDLVKIPGDISSQFITALLFVSTLLKCNENDDKDGIEIEITTPLVSYPYVKITLDVLSSFGINILEDLTPEKKGKYYIPYGQKYRPQVYTIPADFSSAAFIIAAAALSPQDSNVIINNLNPLSPQGDKQILDILQKMGAELQVNEPKHQVIIRGNTSNYPLQGIEVDCKEIPDLFPIMCVLGALAKGKTTLYNASNLRFKECDRISVMARELTKMGVKLEEEKDKLTIYQSNLIGTEIDPQKDHRIAMACIIAALYSNKSSKINQVEVINDSYPNFIKDLNQLGAHIESIK
ncbi:MAG: 3-phosphoshikimate 1-carboxyvinyltransferase [Promethearchaeota archaeon]|nr:MAG: 3-phosphoshikimate 1-carboxyvinyltransferase [Candidatus Lokiarchaeota archaeon]